MAEDSRLLERMRRSKADWTADDLHRLYVSFGFEVWEGRRHRVYIHSRYADLRATVSRASGALPTGYPSAAVRLIDRLRAREEGSGN